MRLAEIIAKFESYWPSSSADDWDRVGLAVGSPQADVQRVLVAVDLTQRVIEEAVQKSCELILTHHPVLLRGVTSLAEDELKGSLITNLIKSGRALFTAHTNADVQVDGASTEMALAFGLTNLKPIVADPSGFGHGVIGDLPAAMTLSDFAKEVSKSLPEVTRKVAFAGSAQKVIEKVAICSGAGDSFLPQVLASEADVYVTSDLRHHVTLDALETPRANGQLALIDVSHWAAESLWVTSALRRLAEIDSLEAIESDVVTDPWTEEVA